MNLRYTVGQRGKEMGQPLFGELSACFGKLSAGRRVCPSEQL